MAPTVGLGASDVGDASLEVTPQSTTAIVEVANEKGFDAPTMLGIARTETHFGTLPSQETSPAKKTDINPTQLSSTSGMQPTTDLKKNIEGSMVIYNRGLVMDNPNQSLQNYNNQADKAN